MSKSESDRSDSRENWALPRDEEFRRIMQELAETAAGGSEFRGQVEKYLEQYAVPADIKAALREWASGPTEMQKAARDAAMQIAMKTGARR
jgi:hypothetical protein